MNENQIFLEDESDKQISLEEVCEILSISTATAKNWIRLKRLIPTDDGANFSKQYIINLYKKIKFGEDTHLKSRRNKKLVNGKTLYKDYISNSHNQKVVKHILSLNKNITEEELRMILANFAIQLYYQSYGIDNCNCNTLLEYISLNNDDTFYSLIIDLLGEDVIAKIPTSNLDAFLDNSLSFVPTEDTLGFVYISLRDLSQRKASGAYYTPAQTISILIERLCECVNLSDKTFCDPCCGTGNFLIGLINKGVSANHIYGQDIDEISIQIARINLFLLYPQVTKDELYSHLICDNTLKNTFINKFDIVLGNPPWGCEFPKDETEYLALNYISAKAKGIESFDIFIEKALSMLEHNGILAFVLPESILSVTSHLETRKLLMEKCSFYFVSYLGNVFSGVQCPAIILGATFDCLGNTVGCKVTIGKNKFTIMQQRSLENGTLAFHISDEENKCLFAISSIHDVAYLHGNAKFALGIVTGNNKEYVSNEKAQGYEIVLKGSDILRYGRRKPSNYIYFSPQLFQQVAPTEIYRAKEKLLYRFISEVPVFTYDNEQTLSLNSCNIVIPQIKDLQIKYVLAILNSSVVAYFISKKFNSVKLLRSHIEQIPIPIVSTEIQEIIVKEVDCIIKSKENIINQYKALDDQIMDLYGLDKRCQEIIKDALSGKNLFLT